LMEEFSTIYFNIFLSKLISTILLDYALMFILINVSYLTKEIRDMR